MTTYHTGNQVGSTAVKDLYDNAENLDHLVNDRSTREWEDRLGVPRKTWNGVESDFSDFMSQSESDFSELLSQSEEEFQNFLANSGYRDLGDYGPGLVITARNQIFRRDGELYRASADLDLPYTTSGAWEEESDRFVSVGDAALRQELAQATGSSLVGFTQSGVGAGSRSVEEKLRESVSPLDFGVYGSESDDHTAMIQAAIDAAPYGVPVDGLGKRYTVSAGLTLKAGSVVQNMTINGATLPNAEKLFAATGTEGAPVLLTENANSGTTSVTVATSAGLSAGDLIFISSDANFYTIGTPGKFGEWCRIKAIVGNILTIYERLYLTYTTAASASIVKVNTIKDITLRNINAVGSGAGGAGMFVELYRCEGVTIENCSGDLFDNRHLHIRRCFNVRITGGSYRRSTQSGLSYGIAITDGCHDVVVDSVRGEDLRHLVTVGGVNGINRGVKAHHCTAEAMREAGFDSHPNADSVDFSHNTVRMAVESSGSGIIFQCPNAIAIGNRIEGVPAGAVGLLHQQFTNQVGSTLFDGNDVIGQGSIGVDITTVSGASGRIFGAVMANNRVRGFAQSFRVYAVGANIEGLAISNNVNTDQLGTTSQTMVIRALTGAQIYRGAVSGNNLRAGSGVAQGLYLLGADAASVQRIAITGNVIQGANAGYGVVGTNTNFVFVDANVIGGFTTGRAQVDGAQSLVGTNI